MKKIIISAIFVFSIAVVANAEDSVTAKAQLKPTEGNKVQGMVMFSKVGDLVKISGEITGLEPGVHGFHIHEFGDCSGKKGKTAGGHFNPAGHDHGGPTSSKKHVGDLGNVTADAKGLAKIEISANSLGFKGDHNILGRGLIVHAKADDLSSQPTGAAGARVACGVIGVAK